MNSMSYDKRYFRLCKCLCNLGGGGERIMQKYVLREKLYVHGTVVRMYIWRVRVGRKVGLAGGEIWWETQGVGSGETCHN